jgi:hypothetical protein
VWLVYVIIVYDHCTGSAVHVISVDVVQCDAVQYSAVARHRSTCAVYLIQ